MYKISLFSWCDIYCLAHWALYIIFRFKRSFILVKSVECLLLKSWKYSGNYFFRGLLTFIFCLLIYQASEKEWKILEKIERYFYLCIEYFFSWLGNILLIYYSMILLWEEKIATNITPINFQSNLDISLVEFSTFQ